MQTIIAEINQKIGASGVVSQECKAVVAEYGQQILQMLLAEVCACAEYSIGNIYCLH